MAIIGKGKLWMDGSDRVSVSTKVPARLASGYPEKFTAVVEGDLVEYNSGWFTDAERAEILAEAERVRKDPAQLKKLETAKKRAVKGKSKSLEALRSRILSKKETMFKKMVQDLMARGATRAELFELVRQAIVESVQNG